MLRRLTLRDFVIVPALELDFHAGFSVLTGETGAGKSILVDALQLALGNRADAGVVREGCARAEVSAEFDLPPGLGPWLDEAGFGPAEGAGAGDDGDGDGQTLLLRRTVDAQGKSRAWVNGSPATMAQLREVADALVDIHGQHAWQSLTRPAAVRELLDGLAGIDTRPVAAAHARRQAAADALARAQGEREAIERERERLAWQIGELDKLAPAADEWAELNAEHQRLAHAQALMDAARGALQQVAEDEHANAEALAHRAREALAEVLAHDTRLQPALDALDGALAQLQDAAHTLNSYLGHAELDPARLAELDGRLSDWLGLARRWRRPPDELPALLQQWRQDLAALDAATDVAGLQAAFDAADTAWRREAATVSAARARAARPLAASVSAAMQQLGMAGGRFEVQLSSLPAPAAHGQDAVELLVAGHAGSAPRPLAKVASGGELSRLALAIAVTAVQRSGAGADTAPEGDGPAPAAHAAGTLIFDEIDAGIGGAVGDTVGALMKQLGRRRQVLAVTHLAQVAACADHHYVVAKALQPDGRTASTVQPVQGEARVAEVARMLGGERMGGTSQAHAQAMLQAPADAAAPDGPAPIPAASPAAKPARKAPGAATSSAAGPANPATPPKPSRRKA